jgi:alpha-beta hydrolase superfamily lysophospholipase
MKEHKGQFPSNTGQHIFYRIWEPEEAPKAVVQIIHGMAEHSARYADFAEFLCENGFVVAAEDHAGHGKTAQESGKYGFFDERFGWDKVYSDLIRFNRQLKDTYNLPVFILGHSMGSFFTRALMIKNPEIANAWIVSGTGNFTLLERLGGSALANLSLLFRKTEEPAKLMHNMSFGAYNKRFKSEQNEYAWLCTDKDVVKKYSEDKYCGGVFSTAFYRDLLYGVNMINKKKELHKIPADTNIFMISGGDDPVGNYGEGVKKVYNRFCSLGLKPKITIYPDMRHEILNEKNKTIVWIDVLKWIEEHMPAEK